MEVVKPVWTAVILVAREECMKKIKYCSGVISNRLLRGWSMDRATTQPVRASHCG